MSELDKKAPFSGNSYIKLSEDLKFDFSNPAVMNKRNWHLRQTWSCNITSHCPLSFRLCSLAKRGHDLTIRHEINWTVLLIACHCVRFLAKADTDNYARKPTAHTVCQTLQSKIPCCITKLPHLTRYCNEVGGRGSG